MYHLLSCLLFIQYSTSYLLRYSLHEGFSLLSTCKHAHILMVVVSIHLLFSFSALSMTSRLLTISLAVLSLLKGVVSFQTARSTSLYRPNLANNNIVTQHKKYTPIATTSLQSSTTTSDEDPYASPQLDTGAIAKYITAAATELGLFSATFQLLDTLDIKLPFAAIAFFFYACSLKSRVFNPLNNQRPDR